MTRVNLLEALRETTEAAVRDLRLPAYAEWEEEAAPPPVVPSVYCCRLPDESAKTANAPYILHQVITGKDNQRPGARPLAVTMVRSVFCVCNADGQEAGFTLLNLMEMVRRALVVPPAIGGVFLLDRNEGVESLVYPDDTAPFALGELISTWYVFGTEVQI